jgi:hypothetical protein
LASRGQLVICLKYIGPRERWWICYRLVHVTLRFLHRELHTPVPEALFDVCLCKARILLLQISDFLALYCNGGDPTLAAELRLDLPLDNVLYQMHQMAT